MRIQWENVLNFYDDNAKCNNGPKIGFIFSPWNIYIYTLSFFWFWGENDLNVVLWDSPVNVLCVKPLAETRSHMHGPSQELIVFGQNKHLNRNNNNNPHAFEPKWCVSNCLFKDGFGFIILNNWKDIARYESDALMFIVQLKSFEIT